MAERAGSHMVARCSVEEFPVEMSRLQCGIFLSSLTHLLVRKERFSADVTVTTKLINGKEWRDYYKWVGECSVQHSNIPT